MAKIRFRYHRDTPDTCAIKWVQLIRRRIATSYEWHVQFVISSADPTAFRKPVADSGPVGVDVGCRIRPDGLRVAYYVGEDGHEGELILPPRWLAGMRKTEDLASIREKNFNTAILQMKNRMERLTNPPAWFTVHTATLGSWRSMARLASLVLFWARHRFTESEQPTAIPVEKQAPESEGKKRPSYPTDLAESREGHRGSEEAKLFQEMESWRQQDKHRYLWQMHSKDQLVKQRRELYRLFLRRLLASHMVWLTAALADEWKNCD